MSYYRARSQANYRRQRQLRGGQPLLVDPSRAQAHIRALGRQGMSCQMIGEQLWPDVAYNAAGSVYRLLSRKKIRYDTEQAILAVRFKPNPLNKHVVDVRILRRMLRSLQAAGWPLNEVDKHRGTKTGSTQSLLRQGHCSVQLFEDIHHWYEKLAYQEPTAKPGDQTRARRCASRNGGYPPACWDDITNIYERPKGARA